MITLSQRRKYASKKTGIIANEIVRFFPSLMLNYILQSLDIKE
jgi:hypothetical protein